MAQAAGNATRGFGCGRYAALRIAVMLCLGAGACGDPDPHHGICTGARLDGPPQVIFGGDRPVEIMVPPDYDPTCPTPLLLILHGYGVSGSIQALYFDAERFVSEQGVLVAAPDGTFDERGNRFWNAHTDYCCTYWNDEVDDVAYLEGLLDEIAETFNVDPDRVYVLGHSNGGMMAYRLACDLGDRLAAVVSLAGPSLDDLSGCVSAPTGVLHLHGTEDDTVLYQGGDNVLGNGGPPYPGAVESAALWASHNDCQDATSLGDPLDLLSGALEMETVTADWMGCPVAGQVTLWTMLEGVHMPAITARGLPSIWTWIAPKRRAP